MAPLSNRKAASTLGEYLLLSIFVVVVFLIVLLTLDSPRSDVYYAYGYLWGQYVGCQCASTSDVGHFDQTFYQRGDVVDMVIENDAKNPISMIFLN
jgi:hypothetical protein